eukprot:TRINITY_DN7623_c0_g1_i1.p1 TRINITY_DN7623_c0_g1~~TRINITY_DN7623_c0_g1_i1.p1  ORF type:complete len:323 (+),score=73.16 TRINITY_DN7623_c0_g1_i1:46-969(+)
MSLTLRHGNRIVIPGCERIKAARNFSPYKGEGAGERVAKKKFVKSTTTLPAPPLPVITTEDNAVELSSPHVTPSRRLSFTFTHGFTFGSQGGKKTRTDKESARKVVVLTPEGDTGKKGFKYKSPAVETNPQPADQEEEEEYIPQPVATEEPAVTIPIKRQVKVRHSTGKVLVKQTLKSLSRKKTAANRSKSTALPVTAACLSVLQDKPVQAACPASPQNVSNGKPSRGPLSPVNPNNTGLSTNSAVPSTKVRKTVGCMVFTTKDDKVALKRAREVNKARRQAAERSRTRSHTARMAAKPLVLPRWNF